MDGSALLFVTNQFHLAPHASTGGKPWAPAVILNSSGRSGQVP